MKIIFKTINVWMKLKKNRIKLHEVKNIICHEIQLFAHAEENYIF